MKKVLSIFILLSMLLCMTSCFLFPDSGEQNEDPEEKYTIALDNSSLSMIVYEKQQLSATVKDSNGQVSQQNVTWTSSNSAITVEGGVVFAKSAGTAIITAKLEDGTSATCEVTSTYSGLIPQIKLNVTGNTLSVAVGQKYTLQPTVYFNGQQTLDDDAAYFYAVSDESVATIDENGVLTAHKTGEATVTVYGYWRGLGGLDLVGGEDAYGLIITLDLAVVTA